MMEQGTEEWFQARLGKITASRVADVMAVTKSGPSASRKNYMMELLCQRLTGKREEGFTSAAMQRGTELEPVARSSYEVLTGEIVREIGFVVHPELEFLGASPDGMVGDKGLIEIKCPNTAQHVACLRSGSPDNKYWLQMQVQMICTGRDWCDFVSFDDRLPEKLQTFISRVDRDAEAEQKIIETCSEFWTDLLHIEAELIAKLESEV